MSRSARWPPLADPAIERPAEDRSEVERKQHQGDIGDRVSGLRHAGDDDEPHGQRAPARGPLDGDPNEVAERPDRDEQRIGLAPWSPTGAVPRAPRCSAAGAAQVARPPVGQRRDQERRRRRRVAVGAAGRAARPPARGPRPGATSPAPRSRCAGAAIAEKRRSGESRSFVGRVAAVVRCDPRPAKSNYVCCSVTAQFPRVPGGGS